MCPNCDRGITPVRKEVCEMCAGTGFYNPQSLPANEIKMDEANVPEAVAADVAAPEVAPEAPAEAVVEAPEGAVVE